MALVLHALLDDPAIAAEIRKAMGDNAPLIIRAEIGPVGGATQ